MGEHWFYSLADIAAGTALAITGVCSLMNRDLNPFQQGAALVYIAAGAVFIGCNYRFVLPRRSNEAITDNYLGENEFRRKHAA